MDIDDRIYIAGHSGMVGSTLLRKLQEAGYRDIITRSRAELDLLDQRAVADFLASERPAHIFMAAGKTGGIYANNTYRADFIYENLMMQNNIIHNAFINEVQKLIFFACSCIYPKDCPQPMNEEFLLSGALEPTNEAFAIAKIAGLKMCEAYNRQYGTEFITVIPTNVYGPNQRYEPVNSMVVPSLIQKFHNAVATGNDTVTIWGSGKPKRDFLYVDDLADASIFLLQNFEGNAVLNIGTGTACSIEELVDVIRQESGFNGRIIYDRSKPDGAAEKTQDITKLKGLGWEASISLEDGIRKSYADYCARSSRIKK